MTSIRPPTTELHQTLTTGKQRRTVNVIVITVLAFMTVVNTAILAGIGILVTGKQQQDRQQAQNAQIGTSVISDLYNSLNDIRNRLAAIQGQPAPLPLTPPVVTTTTVPRSTPTTRVSLGPSPTTTTTTRRSSSTTTSTTSPSTTTTSTSTTTTLCQLPTPIGCLHTQGRSA